MVPIIMKQDHSPKNHESHPLSHLVGKHHNNASPHPPPGAHCPILALMLPPSLPAGLYYGTMSHNGQVSVEGVSNLPPPRSTLPVGGGAARAHTALSPIQKRDLTRCPWAGNRGINATTSASLY